MRKVLFCSLFFIMTLLFMVSLVSADPPGWGNETILTTNLTGSGVPIIFSLDTDSKSDIHIAWLNEDNQVLYRKITNEGQTVISDLQISANPHLIYPIRSVTLLIDKNNNIHIIWLEPYIIGSSHQIYYKKLDNNGNNLTDIIPIFIVSIYNQGPSAILDSHNDLHLFWINSSLQYPSKLEVYYKKLDNNGFSMTNTLQLTNSSSRKYIPSIAVDSADDSHLVWSDDRNMPNTLSEVYYKKIDNNGNPLTDDIRLTFNGSGSELPTIAADSERNLHVVFDQAYELGGEIFYMKLNNIGFNLTDEIRITEEDGNTSMKPRVKIDLKDNVQIFWLDNRPIGRQFYNLHHEKQDKEGNTLLDDNPVTLINSWKSSFASALDFDDNIHLSWLEYNGSHYTLSYKHSFPPKLIVVGEPKIGNSINISLSDPLNPNTHYFFLMSLSDTTGIPLGDGRRIHLDYDGVFETTLFFPGIIGLVNAQGRLNEGGNAVVTWNIPNISALAGYRLYLEYVTIYPGRPMPRLINSISGVKDITLLP